MELSSEIFKTLLHFNYMNPFKIRKMKSLWVIKKYVAKLEAFAQKISLSINLLFSEECRRLFSPKNTGGYFVLQGSLRKRAKWLGLKLKLKFHILDNRIFESPRLTSSTRSTRLFLCRDRTICMNKYQDKFICQWTYARSKLSSSAYLYFKSLF